jgi:hypothetical protein
MASRVCWHCETKAHMTRFGQPVTSQVVRGGVFLTAAYVCDECNFMSIAIAGRDGTSWRTEHGEWMDASSDLRWLPDQGAGRDFPDVPAHVAEAADEAYRCFSIGAYRGAVSLARSVVEATAKEKDITTGRLVDKIDKMHELGLVREHVKEAAHEIRHLGNDMAHGDFVDPVEREEAQEVLGLMAELLNEVFQSPARVERLREARLAKKAGSNGGSGTSSVLPPGAASEDGATA